MKNYVHETLERNKKVISNADLSDIKRMAFAGDKIVSAAIAIALSHYDFSIKDYNAYLCKIVTNSNFSKHFNITSKSIPANANEHTRATVVEACFYLDYKAFGLDFLIEQIKFIPFSTITELSSLKK